MYNVNSIVTKVILILFISMFIILELHKYYVDSVFMIVRSKPSLINPERPSAVVHFNTNIIHTDHLMIPIDILKSRYN